MEQNSNSAVVVSPEMKKALDKAKIALMSRLDTAFFTTILFSLRFSWNTSDTKTAGTDGTTLLMNPNFFMSLNPDERVFLLVHEVLHVAFMHMMRLKERNHTKWNHACDYYINLLLVERGYKMPPDGLLDRKYAGLNSDQIYARLPDPPPGSSSELDLRAPKGEMDAAESAVQDILVRAAIQSKISEDKPGTIPADIEIFLNKLLNPKLPWQRILQRFIQNLSKNDYSFRQPNRRYFPEHHLPSAYSEKVVDLAIAVDSSGSVSDADFLRFVSEVHGIMRMMYPDKITLIQFDAHLRSVDEIKSLRELSQVKFTGRGGTLIGPVLKWANENKPRVLLVFSDGCFRFYANDETKIPTIWLIHNRPVFTAPFGKTIHYET